VRGIRRIENIKMSILVGLRGKERGGKGEGGGGVWGGGGGG